MLKDARGCSRMLKASSTKDAQGCSRMLEDAQGCSRPVARPVAPRMLKDAQGCSRMLKDARGHQARHGGQQPQVQPATQNLKRIYQNQVHFELFSTLSCSPSQGHNSFNIIPKSTSRTIFENFRPYLIILDHQKRPK